MNDNWRPDWHDKENYAHVNSASDEHLAWEFLRRNKRYAEDWREDPRDAIDWKVAPASYDEHLGEVDAMSTYQDLCSDYMVKKLYHPSTPPAEVEFMRYWPMIDHDAKRHPSKVTIEFRLDLSLETQLELAERELKLLREAKSRNEAPVDRRLKLAIDRIPYFRILDGAHQCATMYALGKELFPEAFAKRSNFQGAAKELLSSATSYSERKYKMLLRSCAPYRIGMASPRGANESG